MPTIQTYILMLQMTEIIKKLLEMVSKGGPKIHQKPVQQGNGKRGVRNGRRSIFNLAIHSDMFLIIPTLVR